MLVPLYAQIENVSTPDNPVPHARVVSLYADSAGKQPVEFAALPTRLIANEVPAGIADGHNRDFTLKYPVDGENILLFMSNAILYLGSDYLLDGRNIHMTGGSAPPDWADFVAFYWTRS